MTDKQIARRGLMFVLSSSSGSGKTTLSREMLEIDDDIRLSISVTTRGPRSNEVAGKDYFFTDTSTFRKMKDSGYLLEHAHVYGHDYGTPKKFVEDCLGVGQDILFDIDWQGTQQLKSLMREDLVSVFILPPCLKELEKRLKKRAQDSDEVIESRMKKATIETSHWAEYDYVIINSDLEDALASLRSILRAERLRRTRQVGLFEFTKTLEFNSYS